MAPRPQRPEVILSDKDRPGCMSQLSKDRKQGDDRTESEAPGTEVRRATREGARVCGSALVACGARTQAHSRLPGTWIPCLSSPTPARYFQNLGHYTWQLCSAHRYSEVEVYEV